MKTNAHINGHEIHNKMRWIHARRHLKSPFFGSISNTVQIMTVSAMITGIVGVRGHHQVTQGWGQRCSQRGVEVVLDLLE